MRFTSEFISDLSKGTKIFMTLFILLLFGCAKESKAQSNPYGRIAWAKNVTVSRDTLTLPGFIDEKKTGIITNESATKALEIFFGKRLTTPAIDSTTYFKLPAGKTLFFQTGSTRIYRRATTSGDTVFTQVLLGNVNMGFNEGDSGSFQLVNWNGNEFIIIDNRDLYKVLSRRIKPLTL